MLRFARIRSPVVGAWRCSRTPLPLCFRRWNTQLPDSTDKSKDLLSNELQNRIPKFPLHKDLAPTLIPKSDTPRVGPNMSFKQLVERLANSKTPELIYMAESHRLYFIACFALAFIGAYNLFDMLDQAVPVIIKSFQENDLDGQPIENLAQLIRRFGIVGLMCTAYLVTGLFFATFPSRLVRRIEFVPHDKGSLIRLVTHPWIPGRPSPVITVPARDLSIGNRSKVWTGEGFYGAASKSSFFFFLWEKDRRLPWVVDRSGWFWGDARVYDVLFGKEPIAVAELGLSYDDMLGREALAAEKKKAELRRELGPAWRFKASNQLMKEDVMNIGKRGKAAVMATLGKGGNSKELPEDKKSVHKDGNAK